MTQETTTTIHVNDEGAAEQPVNGGTVATSSEPDPARATLAALEQLAQQRGVSLEQLVQHAADAEAEQANKLSREGFITINPPLPTYQPLRAEHALRGFVLTRQQMPDSAIYYVVQLVAPTTAAVNRDGEVSLSPGDLVLVEETPSLQPMAHMLAEYGDVSGAKVCARAWEIVIEPFAVHDDGKVSYLIHARAATGTDVQAVKPAPPYALVDRPA